MSSSGWGYGEEFSGMSRGFSNEVEQTKKMRLEDVVRETTVCDVPDRGLRKETLEYFGIRVGLDKADGKRIVAFYFPYYDKRNNVCGYKKKDLMLDKNERGHYTAIGRVGVDCQMFGQPQAVKASGVKKNVYVHEGELDVASSHQALADQLVGTKWEGIIVPRVVGISCGTSNAVESVVSNEDFFNGFEKVVLGFDNDKASNLERAKGIKRGLEATENVASVLMKGNLFTVTFEDDMKDPSDYLQSDLSANLSKLLTWDMKRFVAEKVVNADDVGFDEVIAKKPEGVDIPSFPNLMAKIKGFRVRELTVLTSLSGTGKSTYVSEISYHLAKNHKVGMIFLEEETKETVQRMMARDLNINYNKFKFDPQAYASEEDLRGAYDWVKGENVEVNSLGEEETTNRFVFLDHFGSMQVEELMNKIKYLHYVCKCDYIMLDHLTLVVSGSGSTSQTAELDLVMAELAGFCASNNVGVIAISHLNRSAADEIRGISDLEEPKWVCVKKEDMRGSSSLEALSWIVLGIDLEIKPDRTRGRTRLTVLKNRPFGLLGEADTCIMNPITGLLEDASDSVGI